MFVNPVAPLLVPVLLTAATSSASWSDAYVSRSCPELARSRLEADDAASRLAAWMERHCPGSLEVTEPFCRMQSGQLLERLAELGQLKGALEAKGCPLGQVQAASPAGDAASSPLGARTPAIASFEDNWPWPRRRPFQAGLVATAGFKIRKCAANPDCEW